MTTVAAVVDAFLAHHVRFHPVDATFMGLPGRDGAFPPADAAAAGRERDELDALSARLADAAPPASAGEAMDRRLLGIVLPEALALLQDRPRYRDPTWYTGEAAFGLIGLLLPDTPGGDAEALDSRLADLPRFLHEGCGQLAGGAFFAGGVARARMEVTAIRALLDGALPRHALWRDRMAARLPLAHAALAAFDLVLEAMPDADPRCGHDRLRHLMRDVHRLPYGPAEALDLAEAAMARTRTDLVAMAARVDRARSWPEQLADLAAVTSDADAYRACHEAAMDAASALVTPAADYGLSFRPFPAWAEPVREALYFLAYRCPPGAAAGTGSTYWTAPAGSQSMAVIRSTHAVHHGSIGHHTQNARARAAPSRLARLVAQDTARGLAFGCGGTMAEGWACHAQDLMTEVPGFHPPAELLLARWNELRHAACLVADIRFHTGSWDMARMVACLRDEAGFPAARARAEAVRLAIFPGTRLMYWAGMDQVRTARRRWHGTTRDFHDRLLAHGHVPVSFAIEAMFAGR